ncbi:MAG: hypothetical protein ACXVEF_03855 [Polyangiales bacterium]
MKYASIVLVCAMGCAQAESQNGANGGGDDDAQTEDVALDDAASESGDDTSSGDSGSSSDTGSTTSDTGSTSDTGGTAKDSGSVVTDTGTVVMDTGTVVVDTGPTGPITGGPCASGAPGATAFRLKFTNSGGHAMTGYEVTGLPDKTGFKAAAYKTGSIDPSWYPPYDDMYLAAGGLRLDDTDFLDINFSTVGISSISSVTIAVYGRSFATTTSGSYSWQTFEGSASIASGTMSNSTPYVWYAAFATTEFAAGKSGDLLRIKAGPPSGSIIVNRIEVCMEAL